MKRARTRRLQSSQRASEAPFPAHPSRCRQNLICDNPANPCVPPILASPLNIRVIPRSEVSQGPRRQRYRPGSCIRWGQGWPICGAAASTQSCPRATWRDGAIGQPARLHRPAGPPSLPATHPQPRCQPSFQASSWTQECRRIPPLNPCAAAQKAPQPAAPAPALLPQRPCTHPASLLSPSRPRSCFRLLSFLLLSLFHGHS